MIVAKDLTAVVAVAVVAQVGRLVAMVACWARHWGRGVVQQVAEVWVAEARAVAATAAAGLQVAATAAEAMAAAA